MRIQTIYSGPNRARNTDLRVAKEMMLISRFCEGLTFLSMPTGKLNLSSLNFASRRLFGWEVFPRLKVKVDAEAVDLVYKYGNPPIDPWFPSLKVPVFQTTGYPMIRQELEKPEDVLQARADKTAQLLEHADYIHFHTKTAKNAFLRRRPEFEQRVVTIPFFIPYLNCIDMESFEKKYDADVVKLCFVGYQGKRKGLQELCGALDMIADEIKHLKVDITIVSGDAPKFEKITNFSYYDYMNRSNVDALMEDAHIFVLPTKRDTYGLVFIEAMSKGCAVVADDDYPRREILGNDAGLFVSPTDIKELAETLLGLILDRDKQRRLARSGLKRVTKLFAPDVVANQYLEHFSSLVDSY